MPLEPELGMPVEWLRRAKSNLIRAKQPKPGGVFWEDLCFDAQQAVEKALIVTTSTMFDLISPLPPGPLPLSSEFRIRNSEFGRGRGVGDGVRSALTAIYVH